MSDYRVFVTVRDWLLDAGWTRDGDDPGTWHPPAERGESGPGVNIGYAFTAQTVWSAWDWNGPLAA